MAHQTGIYRIKIKSMRLDTVTWLFLYFKALFNVRILILAFSSIYNEKLF